MATTSTSGLVPSTIVQLSDLHLGCPGERCHGVDPAANLRRVGRAVAEMDLRPSAVVLSGDLSDRGEPASYELLAELCREVLEPLGCPVLAVLGNHDDRLHFRRAFLGEVDAADVSLPHMHVVDAGS